MLRDSITDRIIHFSGTDSLTLHWYYTTAMTESNPNTLSWDSYDPTDNHSFADSRLNKLWPIVTGDKEITAYLDAQNVNPVNRLQYNDHGAKHVEIVRDRALQLYSLLKAGGVHFNGAADQGLNEKDEPVIIFLAATLHDIGHVIHRHQHTYYSLPLASNILDRLLPEIYDTETAVKVKSEALHAILCHHPEEDPLTLEAGVIRTADGLDMERGRSRIPYDTGSRGINTLSSQAIQNVTLHPGEDVAVEVEIEMTNAAGVYQVDNLLKAKLEGSLIEDHVRVVAINSGASADQLIKRIEF